MGSVCEPIGPIMSTIVEANGDLHEICVHNSYIIYYKLMLANCYATDVTSVEYRAALAKQLTNDFSSRTRTFREDTRTGSQFLSKPRSLYKMENEKIGYAAYNVQPTANTAEQMYFLFNAIFFFTTKRDCCGIYLTQH